MIPAAGPDVCPYGYCRRNRKSRQFRHRRNPLKNAVLACGWENVLSRHAGKFPDCKHGFPVSVFIGFGKYQIALDRGMQTGNQISLMCPVAGTDDGASRVSADSIGHGPFTADVFSKSASFSVGICIICTSENKRK